MAWYVRRDRTWLKPHYARCGVAQNDKLRSSDLKCIHGSVVGKAGVFGKMMGGEAQGVTDYVFCYILLYSVTTASVLRWKKSAI